MTETAMSKNCTPPDDSNVAGVHDDAFIKTEDVDASMFDEADEAEDHRSDGDLVEEMEEPEENAQKVELVAEETMVETIEEEENPPELETAQDEPEDE